MWIIAVWEKIDSQLRLGKGAGLGLWLARPQHWSTPRREEGMARHSPGRGTVVRTPWGRQELMKVTLQVGVKSQRATNAMLRSSYPNSKWEKPPKAIKFGLKPPRSPEAYPQQHLQCLMFPRYPLLLTRPQRPSPTFCSRRAVRWSKTNYRLQLIGLLLVFVWPVDKNSFYIFLMVGKSFSKR